MTQHASRIETEDGPLVGAARATEQAAHRALSSSQKKVGEAIEGSRSYISDNPLQSVLIAVGVGALVGYMIGRRR